MGGIRCRLVGGGRTIRPVSTIDPRGAKELVVAEDGSIPANQLADLGLWPGTHLRVVSSDQAPEASPGLAGSLADLPDIDWDDFETASELAAQDLARPS